MPRDTETVASDPLIEELRVIADSPASDRREATNPVNPVMFQHWCKASGDHNPVYLDRAVAEKSRHGGLVAPPALLGSWSVESALELGENPRSGILRRLEAEGFTAIVATNYEHEYLQQLRSGDVVSESMSVEEVSDVKQTALGPGVFVTVRHDYFTQADEHVGIARMRLLNFKPPQKAADASGGSNRALEHALAPRRPRPGITADQAFFWEGVKARELRIQRCEACGVLRHPPRPMCGECGSLQWDYVLSAGRGTVYSYAVHHYPPLPAIDTPHTIVLIDLDEGVRFLSELDGDGQLDVGTPVELVWKDVDDEMTLPAFRGVTP